MSSHDSTSTISKHHLVLVFSFTCCCTFALFLYTQIIGGAISNDFIHLWPAAMITAGLMLATRCLSGDDARSSIEWEVYMCIAFAFAVSTAMEKTKVALAIANVFVAFGELQPNAGACL